MKNNSGTVKENVVYILWTLIGNLFPLISGLAIMLIPTVTSIKFDSFYNDGQFYIYSATLLATASYVFWTFKLQNIDKYAILLYISYVIGLFTSLCYALFLVENLSDDKFILYSSLIVFVVSIVIYIVSVFISGAKLDVHEAQRKNIKNIADKLS